MRIHRIPGGGGLRLHVTDQGPENAPPILLIHGWSQDHSCWAAQAPLAEKFRLVTLDMRGHGASEAPQQVEAYSDTGLWASDVKAVIDGLNLKAPVLVGWSYGSRVIASYLDKFGDAAIAGVVLAGGILAIGKARQDWMVGPASPGLNRDLYTDDTDRLRTATEAFIRECTHEPLPEDTVQAFLKTNMIVTPLVRRALFADDWDFQPVYAKLSKPLLVIHGAEDNIVTPLTGITASELPENGDLRLYEFSGHAPFLEAPERFNHDLTQFTETAIGAAA